MGKNPKYCIIYILCNPHLLSFINEVPYTVYVENMIVNINILITFTFFA